MTSSFTETDVCNMALDILWEEPISDITDDDPNALKFARNFDALRDAFLAMHPWNFAIKSVSQAADATDPSYGWDHRYLLPGDCLKVLPIRKNGLWGGQLQQYEIEGQYILTDIDSPLKYRYIYRNETIGEWSPQAITAFAAFLASRLAHSITGKASFAELAANLFKEEMRMAKRMDGEQGMLEKADTADVINVRY